MIITIPQSQISYFIFVECFKILNINILVLRNIENILFNSIINSNKDIINNNCNINALYSL